MPSSLRDVQARWDAFAQSARGGLVLRLARGLFLGAILLFLGFKLAEIGWREVGAALPTQPLFYLLFLLLHFSIPIAEVFIYRLTWSFTAWASLPVFIKKRIYNKDVLGYSGEVFFFTWARRQIALPDVRLAETIRDNNILSAAASTGIAVVLLIVFLFVGQIRLGDLFGRPDVSVMVMVGLALAIGVPVALRFRKYIFALPARTALAIFGIQCLRMTLGQALQIGMWVVVLPAVPLATWFTYAAVSILITRVPVVSNKDLIFLGVGVELSAALGVPEAAIFGLLGAIAALSKVLNFLLFTLFSFRDRTAPPPAAPTAEPAAVSPPVATEVIAK